MTIRDSNRKKCRYDVRVWKTDNHQEWDFVVLSEERADNDGMSVTNNAVGVANAVLLMLLPPMTNPARVAFYERYPLSGPERADRVLLRLSKVAEGHNGFGGYEYADWLIGTLMNLRELLGVTLDEEVSHGDDIPDA